MVSLLSHRWSGTVCQHCFGVPGASLRALRNRPSGKGCPARARAHTHTHTHMPATNRGPRRSHRPRKPTWGAHRLPTARAQPPQTPLAVTEGHAQARARAAPLPAPGPAGLGRTLRARAARVPPRRPRPSGAGRAGLGPAAPPGKLREAGRPPPHPLPPPGPDEPSRAGAEPRAPRARAERGAEPWRTRRASTVRAAGGWAGGRGSPLAAAPTPRRSALVSSPAPSWGSFLFPFAAAGRWEWAHLGACRLTVHSWEWVYACVRSWGGSVCVPIGVDVPVCAHPRSLCLPGVGVPGCAHLEACAPLDVTVRLGSFMHMH